MPITRQSYMQCNETTLYFDNVSKYLILGGLAGYIEWEKRWYNNALYKYVQRAISILVVIFILLEIGAFATQNNLTDKQTVDRWIFTFSHPILTSYCLVIQYFKERIKNVISNLCITLKNVYNDLEVEKQMIRKVTIYAVAFSSNISLALASYGVAALVQVVRSEGTFTTVITAWPDVVDESALANVFRVFSYIMWWICMIRIMSAFLLLVITMGTLCYQYRNLQSYFHSLNKLFDEACTNSSQEAVENEYEKAFKVGVKLHSDTLKSTGEIQVVCSILYSGQIILNVVVVSALFLQMMKSTDRTLETTSTVVITASALLYTTGILMWNAGDVTVEAALVATAMYSSGWENCHGHSSKRIRRLLVIAMNQAQRPVVIKGFGFMDISYQSYVSITKASYSAFSLLY